MFLFNGSRSHKVSGGLTAKILALILAVTAAAFVFTSCNLDNESKKANSDKLNSKATKDTNIKVETEQTKEETNKDVKVIYGKHAYGCKSQEEYDAVIAKLKETLNDSAIAKTNPYVERTDNGDKYMFYDKDSEDYKKLREVDRTLVGFLHFTDRKNHNVAIKATSVVNYFIDMETDKESSSADSAYDVIFNKKGNHIANSQVMSALFDLLGYNTQIVKDGYPKCYVEIDDQWWIGGTWANHKPSGDILSSPTFEG